MTLANYMESLHPSLPTDEAIYDRFMMTPIGQISSLLCASASLYLKQFEIRPLPFFTGTTSLVLNEFDHRIFSAAIKRE